jgi:hypothetical protein
MDTDEYGYGFFNREWTLIHANRLQKNFAGRRCDQEARPQRFLAQPDGQHGRGRVLRSQHSFSIAVCYIRDHPRYLRKNGAELSAY